MQSSIKLTNNNIKTVIKIQIISLIILISLSLIYEVSGLPPDILIHPLCCLLLVLTIWSFTSWYILTKSIFTPYLLYFLSAVIFNGGQALLEVFHLNEDGILADLKFQSSTLLATIFLVTISLASFHLGALFSFKSKGFNHNKLKVENSNTTKACYLVGLGLLGISFFPTITVMMKAISLVQAYGYEALYQLDDYSSSVETTGAEILATFIIPASLFLLAGSKEKPKGKIISGLIIFVYFITKLSLGQRNTAVMPLISYAWLWNQYIKKLPKSLLGISIMFLSIVFPVIAMTRNFKDGDRLDVNIILDSYASLDNPFIATLSEMGGSMLTVAYTMELVPKVRDYQMGADYFYALLTLIPNIFGGKLHPSIARGIADKWLIEQVDPYLASLNSTYGFSFIAEAYLNFGWYGTIIFIGIMGFVFAKFTLWSMETGNPARMAMLGTFISFFLFYPRGESVFIIRPLVWYSLLPYIATHLLDKRIFKSHKGNY